MKRSWLLVAIAIAARADLTQSLGIGDGAYVSLDFGQATTAPAASDIYDIRWTGGSIVPAGKAKIFNVGIRTSAQFDLITESDIKTRLSAISSASIPAVNLAAGDVFDCLTNYGNASKVFVVKNSGGTLSLMFYTYQAAAPGAPKITAVMNNSSGITVGLPNYGIAPSSLFVVQGSGMADAGTPVLQSSASPGIPLTLNGASVTVTVGNVTTHPGLYYTSPGQLAGVLPANTPVGSGSLTVTYKGLTSAPFPITVLPSAPGINYYNTNTGVATDAVTGALLTYNNSGTPGEYLVLWATGLGSDPGDSDTVFSPAPHAVNANLQIYLGGQQAKILYQGSSGYPGVNQINIQVPDNVATGCWVTLAAVVDTFVSNVTTLPVAKGGGQCIDEVTGIKGSQLSPGVATTYRAGFVSLGLSNTPTSGNNANRTLQYFSTANFSRYTGLSYEPSYSITPGSCIMHGPASAVPGFTLLDPGTITLTGPETNLTMQNTLGLKGTYNATLSSIPQTGGIYTWKASGGADIGPFTSTLNLSPLLNWTNSGTVMPIDKSRPLTVTWTGGNPGSYVYISGGSNLVQNGVNAVASFECVEHIEAGQFTVPAYLFAALPAGPTVSVQVANLIYFPLNAAGLDASTGLADIGYTVTGAFK